MHAGLTPDVDVRIHESLLADIKGCSLANLHQPHVECMFGEIDPCSLTCIVGDTYRS